MARKATNKQIADAFSKMAEDYFKASNAAAISDETRTYLTNKWAMMREIAYVLATKNAEKLDMLAGDARSWARTVTMASA